MSKSKRDYMLLVCKINRQDLKINFNQLSTLSYNTLFGQYIFSHHTSLQPMNFVWGYIVLIMLNYPKPSVFVRHDVPPPILSHHSSNLLNKPNLDQIIKRNIHIRHLRPTILSNPQKQP